MNRYTKEELKLLEQYLLNTLEENYHWTSESLCGILCDMKYDPISLINRLNELVAHEKPYETYYEDMCFMMYKTPYQEMPLHINDIDDTMRSIANWRISLGR